MSNSEPPDLPIDPPKSGGLSLSLVWLVPLFALGIALFIAWQSYSSRGPLIEITFDSAAGITANSTVLKYREVDVGLVEKIDFTPDLRSVVVSVRVDNTVAPYIDSGARFWIVRPEVTARGITGLNTVLSGVYLEGTWDTSSGETQSRFRGLQAPPLVRDGEAGLQIVLRADEGGRLQAGAPIVYRGVDVGFMDTPVLSSEGGSVTARAFIKAPHDSLITTGTRFWGASGFSVNLGTGGLSLEVASLAALLEGGVTFSTILPDPEPAVTGAVFDVYTSEEAARAGAVVVDTTGDVPFSVQFGESVSGLEVGAAVELKGLRVGTVTGLGVASDVDLSGANVILRADIALSPAGLGLPEGAGTDETVAFMEAAVASGLRARLASEGLLSQTIKIELVEVPDAPPATLIVQDVPAPAIPTTAASITDVADSARGVLERIQRLPIESVVANVSALLASLERVVSSDGVQQAPAAVVGLVDEARTLLGSDEIRAAITGATASVDELQQILERVNDSDALPEVLAALSRADAIAQSLQDSAAEIPAMVQRISTVAENAARLPLEAIAAAATRVIEDAEALIGSEQIAGLPQTLATSLNNLEAATRDVRTATSSLTEGGTMDSVRAALVRAGSIARSLDESAAGLPMLISRVEAVAATAAALPLADLAASADGVLQDTRSIIGSPAALQLPASVNATLAELSSTIGEVGAIATRLSQGPAIDNLLAALQRSDAIAQSVQQTTAGLPDLVSRIEALTAEAAGLPLAELTASADRLLASAETIVGSEAAAQLPASVNQTLTDLSAALADVKTITDSLAQGPALQSLTAALERTGSIAQSLDETSAGLPALLTKIENLADKVDGLELQDLVASANDLVVSADTLVSSPETAQLPASLSSALDQLAAALAELREGGAVANTNATLQSASEAADAIAAAARGLPELTARLDQAIASSEQVLTGYGPRSEFNNQTLGALRDLRSAARAVTSLAQTIERKPNSLLIGR